MSSAFPKIIVLLICLNGAVFKEHLTEQTTGATDFRKALNVHIDTVELLPSLSACRSATPNSKSTIKLEFFHTSVLTRNFVLDTVAR